MKISIAGGLVDRLRAAFPDREFIMRSQGQVRFIRISSRLQIVLAGAAGFLVLSWIATLAGVAIARLSDTHDRITLLDREARAISAEKRVSKFRASIDTTADDLARRQDFIEKMVEAHLGDVPTEGVSDPAVPAQAALPPQAAKPDKISAASPGLGPETGTLGRFEVRQLAFVERLTHLADLRSAKAAQTIRALGLNPGAMVAALDDTSAQGGPLLRLATSASGKLDPRFRRLGASLARMSVLERGLAGIPQVQPASAEYISSGFGYRSDPFTGEAALHAGLDFAGPIGSPIYAAAKGRVSFAGQRQGYGNCIEIDHGNGLMTRYAHMSAFRAHIGQEVGAGSLIGAIGNSGRSTGPHLHFEVRINDRPVNPRPFLEAALHVQENRNASSAAGRR